MEKLCLLLAAVSLFSGARAIVCTPALCEGVKQEALNCEGEVIEKGGFCGCTDVCAGVDGDGCETAEAPASHLFGLPPPPRCSQGYECTAVKTNGVSSLGRSNGVCRKVAEATTRGPSVCERTRSIRMISMVMWRGWYIPRCNPDGTFVAKQCDNTGACFCVTPQEGTTLEETKRQSQDVQC